MTRAEFWEGLATLVTVGAATAAALLWAHPADAAEMFAVNIPASPEDLIVQLSAAGALGVSGGVALHRWAASRPVGDVPAPRLRSEPQWRGFGRWISGECA